MERVAVINTNEGALDLRQLDQELAAMETVDRIRLANRLFGEDLIAATSFGPTSGVLLSLLRTVHPNMRVITIRHGHETEQTIDFAERLKRRWDLNLRVYQADYMPVPEDRSLAFEDFRIKAKIVPFGDALKGERARAWLSGVMWSESNARAQFRFVMIRKELPVFYPILDWSAQRIEAYCRANDIPVHTSYYDPTKGAGQNQECGLHMSTHEAQ